MKSVDLSKRAKFRVTGKDRVRYLNGQVSNDVRKVSSKETISACVTTAKGKLEGLIWISEDTSSESLLIDADPELRESLMMRLSKYIISDDVEIFDVTEDYQLIHDLGHDDDNLMLSNRFCCNGVDRWIKVGDLIAGSDWMSDKSLEEYRIKQGVPAWGYELNSNTLPQEALLERKSVDFHKGCYVGQEFISRLKSVGQVRRLLVGLTFSEGPTPESSWELLDDENKKIGEVTSVCKTDNELIGLGYVKTGKKPIKSNNIEKNLHTEVILRHTPFTD